MTMQDQDFWRRATKAAPGLFDLGVGMYGAQAGQKEADQRIAGARGPQYDALMKASTGALASAGNMDPKAAAAERFNAQRGLLAGADAADEASLLRMLHSKGMLDVANFNPGVAGIAPSGTAMNPHMAAFYAARGGRDAKMAADSLDAGDAQLDNMLKRSGMLQTQAGNLQARNLEADKLRPSRSAATMNLLKGAGSIFRDMGGIKGASGMIGGGWDWLKNLGGGGAYSSQGTDFGDWYGW